MWEIKKAEGSGEMVGKHGQDRIRKKSIRGTGGRMLGSEEQEMGGVKTKN